MTDIQVFFAGLREVFGGQVMTILALTLAQVVLAVAVALKNGSFELKKLADFFRTIIVPKLLGWMACAILAQFALPEYLPGALGPGIALAAFVALVGGFLGSILESLSELGILPKQLNGALEKLGIFPGAPTGTRSSGVPF